MPMIRIGIIRGGTGDGYEESLKSGAAVLAGLPRDRYAPVDIFIDRSGAWHMHGRPLSLEKLSHRVDVLWNLTSGFYGGDGKMHQLFEQLGIPYVGPSPVVSATLLQRRLFKAALGTAGVKAPRSLFVSEWKNDEPTHVAAAVDAVFERFAPPWIVHAVGLPEATPGIRCATRGELHVALAQLAASHVPVMIEEEVTGREAQVLVAPGLRSKELYTFLPRQMRSEHAPRLSPAQSDALQRAAAWAHKQLSVGSHAVVTGTITPKGEVYITGMDAHPSFAPGSHAAKSMSDLGVTIGEFADNILAHVSK